MRRPDEFMKLLQKFFGELSQHARLVLIGAVVLIGISVVTAIVLKQRESSAEKAKDALFLAKKSPVPQSEVALQAVVEKFSGTLSAHEATLTLAGQYLHNGQLEKAISWYEKATASASGVFEKILAFGALGYAYEDGGKYSDAIKSFEKAMQLNAGKKENGDALGPLLTSDYMLAIARCYEAMHDLAKARSTYDQIVSQFPNSPNLSAVRAAEIYRSKLE